jgi:hypothetical protein
MEFIDYTGLKIELSEEVWTQHIKSVHPELTEDDLNNTLSDPDEVWASQKRSDTELYYKKKINLAPGKIRYSMVAVKKIPTGNFISSAMTKSTVAGSKLIFRKP